MSQTCANCRFYEQPKAQPDSAFVPSYVAELLRGWCRRFPQWVERRPEHWCGEFSEGA